MKHYKIISILLLLCFLSACTRVEPVALLVDVPYVAKNPLKIRGQVAVGEYGYIPQHPLEDRIKHPLKDTQIIIPVKQLIAFPEPLGIYYRNALRDELQLSGASLQQGKCRLTGTLHKFLTTYDSNILHITASHILYDNNGNVIYRDAFITTRHLSSRAALRTGGQINEALSKNITEMLKDKTFTKALERC